MKLKHGRIIVVFLGAVLLLISTPSISAPAPEAWPFWEKNDPNSSITVDHGVWDHFLEKYLMNDPSGVNLVRYGAVSEKDRRDLNDYINKLTQLDVDTLDRAEQKAYWINLYNALTVKVVLDHYPVKSIRDIDISPGIFSDGPWKKKLVVIKGEAIALDDIEHRILRPIWKDNRVHYALNCASIGCPNLAPTAYTAENMEKALEKAARDYINSPRGARFDQDRLVVSSIYDWYQVDFGNSERGVIDHLLIYAEDPLAGRLKQYQGGLHYEYNWNLNAAE